MAARHRVWVSNARVGSSVPPNLPPWEPAYLGADGTGGRRRVALQLGPRRTNPTVINITALTGVTAAHQPHCNNCNGCDGGNGGALAPLVGVGRGADQLVEVGM